MTTNGLLSDEELLAKLPTPALVGLDEMVTWHDLMVLTDPRYPESQKAIAAQWIAYCWFRRPIAIQRWRAIGWAIKEALNERAGMNETNPQSELRASVVQALFLAGREPVDLTDPGPRKIFLRKLNNLVVEDLLGPHWQKRPSVDIGEFEHLFDEGAGVAETEASLELEAMIAKAELGPKEAQVVIATYHGEQADQIAAKLDMKPGAVRTALSRARSKLRDAH